MFSVSLVHFVRIVPEFTCKSQFLFVCWQKHVHLKHSIPLIDTFVTCCILSLSYQNRRTKSYMVKCSNRIFYKWVRNCMHSVTSLVRSLPFVSLLSFLKRSKSRLLRSRCCVCVCVGVCVYMCFPISILEPADQFSGNFISYCAV